MALPPTDERVLRHTPEHINRAIRDGIERSVAYHRNRPEEIGRRLEALDHEWDIERALEANASSLILATSALGFAADRRFFAVPVVVSAFLLQHALQGWCPPLPVLRRLGYRTSKEIEEERQALEQIRAGVH